MEMGLSKHQSLSKPYVSSWQHIQGTRLSMLRIAVRERLEPALQGIIGDARPAALRLRVGKAARA